MEFCMLKKVATGFFGLALCASASAGDWTNHFSTIKENCSPSEIRELIDSAPKSLKKDIISSKESEAERGTVTNYRFKNATLFGSPFTRIEFRDESAADSITTIYFSDTRFMQALPQFYVKDQNGLIMHAGTERFWASLNPEKSHSGGLNAYSLAKHIEFPTESIPDLGGYYQMLFYPVLSYHYSFHFTKKNGYLSNTGAAAYGYFMNFDENQKIIRCQTRYFGAYDEEVNGTSD